ncbi:MAG: MATE family efflux transporter [Oscillospiraceae bacterium]
MSILHKSRHDTDMTQGSISGLLFAFAVPLMIGNLFQQLYNTVDSLIVGNFVSKQALAAVGCTGPIINTLIGLFSGLATGASVVISQYYGAKDEEKLGKAVHTTVMLTLVTCVVLTVVGVWATPLMLELMDTPPDVFSEAELYLRIYFGGVSGLLLYNIGSGILRAVGDSTRPLYFLIFSAVMNTVLDLFFVAVLKQGIAGAAIATIISQFVSAILVMLLLLRSKDSYRLEISRLRMHKGMLRRICNIGIPSSLQMGITAFSNIFVMGYINHFESSCMAGWTAYNKLDALAMLPMQSLSLALTTFVGQNLGAGDLKRAKAGPRYGLIMGYIVTAIILVPMMVFAPQLTALFNDDREVIEFGTLFVRLCTPFYVAFVINQVYSGALRGAGDAKNTMYIMLFSFVVFRQIYLFIVSRMGATAGVIALGYPMGWMMCSALLLIYYYKGHWARRLNLVKD